MSDTGHLWDTPPFFAVKAISSPSCVKGEEYPLCPQALLLTCWIDGPGQVPPLGPRFFISKMRAPPAPPSRFPVSTGRQHGEASRQAQLSVSGSHFLSPQGPYCFQPYGSLWNEEVCPVKGDSGHREKGAEVF